jgi:hypothetical protein
MIALGRQSRHYRFRRRVQAEEGLRLWPTIFPALVYLLCFLTSTACALLLARSYRAPGHDCCCGARSASCSSPPTISSSFSTCRAAECRFQADAASARAFAVGILLFGFIWDLEEIRLC